MSVITFSGLMGVMPGECRGACQPGPMELLELLVEAHSEPPERDVDVLFQVHQTMHFDELRLRCPRCQEEWDMADHNLLRVGA